MSELREAAQAVINRWYRLPGDNDRAILSDLFARLRAALAQPESRPCTCHPDDNPPQPCAQRYALTECKALAQPEAEAGVSWGGHNVRGDADSIAEVRRLIDFEQARQGAKPASEPQEVTVLPDGSAFGVMSFPLPIDHWLCREREYLPGKDEPVDLPRPVLTHALREHVVAAVRYAVRGATNCGMELDFDPDALVLNAVYALCGPYCREDSCDTDSPISADGGLTWNSR